MVNARRQQRKIRVLHAELQKRARQSFRRLQNRILAGRIRLREPVLIRGKLRERAHLERRRRLIRQNQVPKLLRTRHGVDGKDRVSFAAADVLLERQVRFVDGVVPEMQRADCVRAAGQFPCCIVVRAGERVLAEVTIRREVDVIRRRRNVRAEPVRDVDSVSGEAHERTRADCRAIAGQEGLRVTQVRKEKRIAGHFAALYRVREIAVEERPAIRLRRDRHEIDAVEIQKIRERRSVLRSRGILHVHVSRKYEAIEL